MAPTTTFPSSWDGKNRALISHYIANLATSQTSEKHSLTNKIFSDFSTVVYSDTTQSYSNITFSVCGGISGFCGDGACQSWRSSGNFQTHFIFIRTDNISAVCQHYEPLDVEKCFGQYNLDTSMRGLSKQICYAHCASAY
jgi:hypothetical protein